jgi:hypothetical protein
VHATMDHRTFVRRRSEVEFVTMRMSEDPETGYWAVEVWADTRRVSTHVSHWETAEEVKAGVMLTLTALGWEAP